MYQNVAIVAGFLLVYSAVAGRVERSSLSGPIIWSAVGLLFGPAVLGIVQFNLTADWLRTLAEFTLAMVLLTDAANADLGIVRRNRSIPQRLLLIGLPLTILLGCALAWLVFPSLALLEIALLAAILAPTDAALGAPVVSNKSVPSVIRESLNFESGLNDGICVPLVLILLGYAVGKQVHHDVLLHVTMVVAEEIGIGLAAGLVVTQCATLIVRFANRSDWIEDHWRETPVLALAITSFAAAQAIGGSGFIACFISGLMLSRLPAPTKHDLLRGAETSGRLLGLVTWVVFGAAIIPWMMSRMTWASVVYAGLSLTVIRMAPVFLCLYGTGMTTSGKLFVGWFGPRGLASLVFAIIVLDENLPGNDVVMATIGCTILFSVVAHGMTANLLVRRIARSSPPLAQPGDVR